MFRKLNHKDICDIAVQLVSDTLILTDLNGKVLWEDGKCDKLLGKKIEHLGEVLDTQTVLPELLKGLGIHTFSFHHEIFEGSEHVFDCSSKKVKVQNLDCLIVVCNDTTYNKMHEHQVIQASKLESIEILSRGLAHDFNNVLSGVTINIDLALLGLKEHLLNLENTAPVEKAIKNLSRVEQVVIRARHITSKLISFTQDGAEDHETLDIKNIIKETAEFSIKGKGTVLNLDLSDSEFNVKVNATQMMQVINNLVINACEAMTDNAPENKVINLSASLQTIEGPNKYNLPKGSYVVILINDLGGGIPKHLHSQIFDPYFTTKEEGSGLGLASVYSIIKNHKGFITFKTDMGVGTTFIIYLPAQLEKKKELPTYKKGQTRLLLIDDDIELAESLKELLGYSGYFVELAHNIGSAISTYSKYFKVNSPFDYVVTDLSLEQESGIGILNAIRDINPKAKVVLSTGYDSQKPEVLNYKLHGFNAVLLKPYSVDSFIDTLNSLKEGVK